MRRTRYIRRVWTTLSAASLLLAVATAGLWVTAQWRWLEIWLVTEHGRSEPYYASILGDEKGTVVYRCGARIQPTSVDAEWEQMYRLFEAREPSRFMPSGAWDVEVRSGWRDDPSGSLAATLGDPDPTAPTAADSYMRSNDIPAEVPYWQPLLAFGLLPLTWFALRVRASRRTARRRAAGRCSACGYDLRATRERCPECGTVPPGPARPVGAGGGDQGRHAAAGRPG